MNLARRYQASGDAHYSRGEYGPAIEDYKRELENLPGFLSKEILEQKRTRITELEKEKEKQDFRLFYEAAKQGDAGAQIKLGKCFAKGTGVQQDDAKAAHWFQEAVNQGSTEAQSELRMLKQKQEKEKKKEEERIRLQNEQNKRDYERACSDLHKAKAEVSSAQTTEGFAALSERFSQITQAFQSIPSPFETKAHIEECANYRQQCEEKRLQHKMEDALAELPKLLAQITAMNGTAKLDIAGAEQLHKKAESLFRTLTEHERLSDVTALKTETGILLSNIEKAKQKEEKKNADRKKRNPIIGWTVGILLFIGLPLLMRFFFGPAGLIIELVLLAVLAFVGGGGIWGAIGLVVLQIIVVFVVFAIRANF
jgi:hypothetical protein